MRQNQNAKRSRGRGRRSGNSGQNSFNRNTTFESNGPEGRLRGNAQQLFEKYTSLANDAQSAGERVLFEANSQFADHYYRIHQSILANAEQRRQNDERAQARKGKDKADEAASDEALAETASLDSDAADATASKDGTSEQGSDESAAEVSATEVSATDESATEDSAAVA